MNNKPVVVWNGFNGEFEALYPSIKTAAKDMQISLYNLNKYIASGEKFNRKYISYYYKEDAPDGLLKQIVFPIQQYREGQLINQFQTITEAAAALEVTRDRISEWCDNDKTDIWGCTWKNLRKLI